MPITNSNKTPYYLEISHIFIDKKKKDKKLKTTFILEKLKVKKKSVII